MSYLDNLMIQQGYGNRLWRQKHAFKSQLRANDFRARSRAAHLRHIRYADSAVSTACWRSEKSSEGQSELYGAACRRGGEPALFASLFFGDASVTAYRSVFYIFLYR